MSTDQQGAPATPATPAPPGTQQPAPPAAGAAPPASAAPVVDMKAEMAKAAAEAQTATLAALGFKNIDEAKAAQSALDKLQKERLTADERARIERDELTAKASKADIAIGELKAMQDGQIAKLSDDARKQLESLAGNDPVERSKYLRFLAAAAPAPASPGVPPAAPPLPPANTGAPPGAPPPGAIPSAYDHWQTVQQRDPVLGAVALQMNHAAIQATRPPLKSN